MYLDFKRKLRASILIPVFSLLIAALSIGTYAIYRMEDTITSALCPPIAIESLSDANAAEGFELSKQIVQEGSILVKNDNNVLPLKNTQKKVNVFGHGAVDWIIGGSGSGQIQREPGVANILFLDALKQYGVEYNEQLITMYNNFYAPQGTKDSLNTFYQSYYQLYEPSINDASYYTDALKTGAKNYSDTAFVVISRRAGETEDPPRVQYKAKPSSTDKSRHYLEISTEEEGLLKFVGSSFENVVVIINSTNTMELDFMDSIPGLDACLIVGATGTRGAAQIPYILYGDNAYPSGRTVDTYPYSFSYNINYGYTGIDNIRHYSNGGNLYPVGVSRNAGVQTSSAPSYVDYVEGIYLGYKWFETADVVGYWDSYGGYDKVVQYPFGYGMSYTTFDWKIVNLSHSEKSEVTNLDTISIDIDVTNTGNFIGKDVIEAYVTAPYTAGGIEKAHVNLVGIVKTPEIKPGETMKVTLKINVKDFESYDCYDKNKNGFKGYELEEGEYQIKLMSDCHNIKKITDINGNKGVDGILKYSVSETIKVSTDEITGNKVENRFTGSSAEGKISIDGSDSNVNIPYISRTGFPKLNELVAPANRAITSNVSAYNIYSASQASAWDKASTDIFGNPVPTSAPKWGMGTGSKKLFNNGNISPLGLKLAQDYNSPEWDAVMDSVKFDEAVKVTGTASWTIQAIDSVGKPKTSEYDGPAQVRSFNAGTNCGTGFPCGTVLAQTWSTTLAYNFGINYGKEMSAKSVDGAYAFGCNIHRSPFQGRNYEYLSECGNLTAILLTNMVQGLQNTGKYCFLKHLVVAETEHEREAMYTWLTEQTLREIYLKPFQKVIQDAKCVGIMSSYNRIGGIWTGGSEHLLTGILRYEWGFNGAIITDYADHVEFMNGGHSNRAGGNLGLNTNWNKVSGFSDPTTSSSPRLQHRLREATKQILFMMCYVKYANDQYNKYGDTNNQIISYSSLQSWIWWKPLLTTVQIFTGGGILIGLYFIFRPTPTKKTKKEING